MSDKKLSKLTGIKDVKDQKTLGQYVKTLIFVEKARREN